MVGISFALFEFFPLLLIGYFSPMISKKFKTEKLILFSAFIYALSLVLMGSTSIYLVVTLAGMLLNASSSLLFINWSTAIQTRTPNKLLGRISGTMNTIYSMAMPTGGAISSLLVANVSPQLVMIGFGLLVLVFPTFVIFTPFLEKKETILDSKNKVNL